MLLRTTSRRHKLPEMTSSWWKTNPGRPPSSSKARQDQFVILHFRESEFSASLPSKQSQNQFDVQNDVKIAVSKAIL